MILFYIERKDLFGFHFTHKMDTELKFISLTKPCIPENESYEKQIFRNRSNILVKFIITFLPFLKTSLSDNPHKMSYKHLLESSLHIARILRDSPINYLSAIGKVVGKSLKNLYDSLYSPLPPISSDEMFHLLDKLERGECLDIESDRRALNPEPLIRCYDKVDTMVSISIGVLNKIQENRNNLHHDSDDDLYE